MRRYRPFIVLLAIFFAALTCMVIHADWNLSGDEGYALEAASHGVWGCLKFLYAGEFQDVHPPLFYVLLAAAQKIPFVSPVAAGHLLSVMIFFFFLIAILYGNSRLNGARGVFRFLLLLLCSPLLGSFAFDIRMYGLLTFFMTWAWVHLLPLPTPKVGASSPSEGSPPAEKQWFECYPVRRALLPATLAVWTHVIAIPFWLLTLYWVWRLTPGKFVAKWTKVTALDEKGREVLLSWEPSNRLCIREEFDEDGDLVLTTAAIDEESVPAMRKTALKPLAWSILAVLPLAPLFVRQAAFLHSNPGFLGGASWKEPFLPLFAWLGYAPQEVYRSWWLLWLPLGIASLLFLVTLLGWFFEEDRVDLVSLETGWSYLALAPLTGAIAALAGFHIPTYVWVCAFPAFLLVVASSAIRGMNFARLFAYATFICAVFLAVSQLWLDAARKSDIRQCLRDHLVEAQTAPLAILKAPERLPGKGHLPLYAWKWSVKGVAEDVFPEVVEVAARTQELVRRRLLQELGPRGRGLVVLPYNGDWKLSDWSDLPADLSAQGFRIRVRHYPSLVRGAGFAAVLAESGR